LTIFELEFLPSARKEWDKLGKSIQTQFANKLKERLENPQILSARLSDLPDCYKIKLRSAGYRLVYRVDDVRVVVVVIAVGKREQNAVYRNAAGRV